MKCREGRQKIIQRRGGKKTLVKEELMETQSKQGDAGKVGTVRLFSIHLEMARPAAHQF